MPDNHGVSRPPAQDVTFQDRAQAPNRLKCSTCGIEVDAGCDCGAPYVPAAKRVPEYDKAKPGRSTRAAAADLGISNKTVSKARQAVTEVTPGATITGRDGKNYPAKKSKTKEEAEIIERDRKACIALHGKVRDAEREQAQWLADHPGHTSQWLNHDKDDEPAVVTDDLTIPQIAVALKKIGGNDLSAAFDLVPNVLAEVLRQHKRPPVNKVMTDALRAGLSTRKPGAAHEAAIQKITMELQRLNLEPNDISIVIRKPSDVVQELEDEPNHRQDTSHLIKAGNGVSAEQSVCVAHAAAEATKH